jgi:hypothetical protein
MRFFRIRLRVRDDEDKTYNPQEIVGTSDEETAIALCKQEWVDCGYEVLEVRSCEEIFPTAVSGGRAIF